MRCAAHTLNLVATMDAKKALGQCSLYKKVSRSAFEKAQELWNKQSKCNLQHEVEIIIDQFTENIFGIESTSK